MAQAKEALATLEKANKEIENLKKENEEIQDQL